MYQPDPGENQPAECWLLDEWLEPEPPELPTYIIALQQQLQHTVAPEGMGSPG